MPQGKQAQTTGEGTEQLEYPKVEHPFHPVNNLFRQRQIRYKGLAKNRAQFFSPSDSWRFFQIQFADILASVVCEKYEYNDFLLDKKLVGS